MTVVKNQLADGFVRALPRNVRALLIYGPDAGLVSERAQAAVTSFLEGNDDPLAHVRLGEDDLRGNVGRLADEAMSIAMFGGRRAVHVRARGMDIASALESVAGQIADDTLVIVEAGDLRPTSALRKFFEKTDSLAAIPCYADDDKDIGRLIDEELRASGLRIEPDARALLSRQLGGDRMATRLELAKLALYAQGAESISIDDVRAISGDTSLSGLDGLADSTGLGDLAGSDRATQRHLRAGVAPADIVSAALRHFVQLHELRSRVDAGDNPRTAVDSIRPPVFFKRKNGVARQCGIWSLQSLSRALDILHEAERQTRMLNNPALAADCASRALLAVAVLARSRQSG